MNFVDLKRESVQKLNLKRTQQQETFALYSRQPTDIQYSTPSHYPQSHIHLFPSALITHTARDI